MFSIRRKVFLIFSIGFFFYPAVFLWASEADRLYHKALDAYLIGDYDEAILHAARALQVEPNFKRAAELLSTLIAEKEELGKKEVWIGRRGESSPSKTAPMTVRVTEAASDEHAWLWEELHLLRDLITRLEQATSTPGMEDLERRLTVAVGLLMRHTTYQYDALRGEQQSMKNRLERLEQQGKGKWRRLLPLYALSTSSLFLALLAWRRSSAEKQQRHRLNRS